MTFVSSASVEALVQDILEETLPIALTLVDPGPGGWGNAAAAVQVIPGRVRLAEEEPPVILVAYNGIVNTDTDGDITVGTVAVLLTVEAGALWDRGARDVVGILLAGARIALLSRKVVTGWSDESIPPSEGSTERTLAQGTALVHLKLPVGPKRGRPLSTDTPITEATITVERRPPDGQ